MRLIDQQIDVAVRTLLAGGRPSRKGAQVQRTVLLGDLVERVAAEAKLIQVEAAIHSLADTVRTD